VSLLAPITSTLGMKINLGVILPLACFEFLSWTREAEAQSGASTREQIVREAVNAENQTPIDVFGKVVDQFGTPVGGIAINGGVLIDAGNWESRSMSYSTTTDDNGLFQFTGLHGVRFGVKMQGQGYEFNPNLYINWWNRYKPDREHPAVFQVYKLSGAQQLVHNRFDCRVPYDGHSSVFNLLKGRGSGALLQTLRAERITEPDHNLDLKITLTRKPLVVRRGVDRFEWRVDIELPGGSLAECTALYPYEAPEGGYSQVLTYEQERDSRDWTNRLAKTFYVRTRSSEYGRLSIDLSADSERDQGTGMTVEVFINPSGSRNLEYNPLLGTNIVR